MSISAFAIIPSVGNFMQANQHSLHKKNTSEMLIAEGHENLGNIFEGLTKEKDTYKQILVDFLQLCSFGFFIATVFKFKQYKDNPTQIPVSTPFALLMVTILAYTSTLIIKPASQTLFGGDVDNTCTGLPGTDKC
jgi:hypothetical protein